MALDHEAIRKAYPNAVTIDDSAGAFDASGNSVSLDQTKIDAARTTLNNEAAATLYQRQRTGEAGTTDTIYPSIGDQLDNLYKDILAGTLTSSGTFAKAIEAVKAKYPKP
tara:strand:- start:1414 stop:1743 length:330 start_codon:yes stop_codon:yes gene_type:complete